MKRNEPVTQQEHPVPDDVILESKTSLKGVVTYVNPDFVDISGFSAEELIGKSHNVVRHPDMPAVFFEDLRCTLKSGNTWTGIIKNRCKSGDHYWVNANVTPVLEGHDVVECLSVRTSATREQIKQAEEQYAQFNADQSVRLPRRRSISARAAVNSLTALNRICIILLMLLALTMLEGRTLGMVLGAAASLTLAACACRMWFSRTLLAPLSLAVGHCQAIAHDSTREPLNASVTTNLVPCSMR